MNYRLLGRTGLKVSELGLGTAQLGGTSMIAGRPLGAKSMPQKDALEILDCAFNNGINFFDTSDKYGDGLAEKLLGKFLREKNAESIVATKCGITSEGKRDFSKEYIIKCANESQKRLETCCIDVFQLTKPSLETIHEGKIFDTLDYLKAEGIIRFSGISIGEKEEGLEILESNAVDTLQILYNLLDVSAAKELLPRAHKKNIGIIIKSPLSSGLLSGKYGADTEFPEYDIRGRFLHGEEMKTRAHNIELIMKKFNLTKKTLIDFSILFLLSNKHISTIIPGASSAAQLKYNLSVLDKKSADTESFQSYHDFLEELNKM